MSFPASFNLATLNGDNGFVINGIDAFDYSGSWVSNAGDINGDGFDDILIGAYGADPNGKSGAGETYVVFGKTQDFNSSFNLSSLNGTNGFMINGVDAFDYSGSWVSSAGDINSDGFDDILIGEDGADPSDENSEGETYLIFGSNQGFNPSLNLSSLNSSNGFVINGINTFDDADSSVNMAGDINGDGFDDLILGLYGASPNGKTNAGETYVIFGSPEGLDPNFDFESLDGSNGFVINGIDAFDFSGFAVSSAGDINGDGFDDILIGADLADPNSKIAAGETYVVFGRSQGFNSSLNLSDLNGSNGFVINGINALDYSGISVSTAGDVNGDGFDDILIGADGADPNGKSSAGETYVIFGQAPSTAIEWNTATGIVSSFSINLSTGKASTNPIGRTIQDKNWELQTTGDLNGDGQADVILRHALEGQHLVWYMAQNGQSIQSEAIIGRNIADPNWSISGTGDLNSDGNIDLILRNQAADQIVAWYMDGNGGIQSEAIIGRSLGDNNWKIEAVADFNGDGKSDMVLRNSFSGQNLLWEMDNGIIIAETLIGRDIPDQNWHIEGASDFDNNGTIDLFLRHQGVGQGLLWSMADKTAIASEQFISNVPTGISQLVF